MHQIKNVAQHQQFIAPNQQFFAPSQQYIELLSPVDSYTHNYKITINVTTEVYAGHLESSLNGLLSQ